MANNGVEEFVGQYLTFMKGCDFVKYNIPYKADLDCDKKQQNMGEADVVGVNIKENKLYICEVTAELQGMGKDNFDKYVADDVKNKFEKNKNYFSKKYPDYEKEYMLWFPFAPSKERMPILEKRLKEQDITAFYGKSFLEEIDKLIEKLSKNTQNLTSPFARFLQIYGLLRKKCKPKLKND